MRIAYEADYSGAGTRGGTHYTNHLLRGLSALLPDSEILVFGFFWHDFSEKSKQIRLPQAPNVKPDLHRWPQSVVKKLEWDLKLPVLETYLKARDVDIYHCFRPPSRSGKGVVVVQPDITGHTKPEWHPAESLAWWEGAVKPGLFRADAIVTFCQATRNDMIRLGIPEAKIHVTHLGVDHELFKAGPEPVEDFFLMVGPLDVVANFETVLGALKLFNARIKVAGPVDDYVRRLQKRAEAEGVADRFEWLGYVPHKDLAGLYRRARGLLHPSNLPGVELPPYESMACGTPVITSLEENIADAGLLIDEKSPAELAAAMRKLAESDSLRAELSKKGLERAAQFTWRRCAEETLAVYKRIL